MNKQQQQKELELRNKKIAEAFENKPEYQTKTEFAKLHNISTRTLGRILDKQPTSSSKEQTTVVKPQPLSKTLEPSVAPESSPKLSFSTVKTETEASTSWMCANF
ncbi:MAG: hypothetical protein R6T87_02445 [Marinobacter sp.]